MTQPVVFFIDSSLGGLILKQALQQEGEQVALHDEHFPQGTLDVDWLPDVALRGWLILSADQRIRYNEIEWLAVLNSGAKVFVLVSGNLTGEQQAQAFVQVLKKMKNTATREPKGFIALVYRNGRLILPKRNRDSRKGNPAQKDGSASISP
ncbi:MAG: hypothetical protein H7Y22_00200 [Gemmatimonadaceae bacterium]|nr:hypothetical protein [Gloeobacterales cyanobacterium ES-bin-141]